MTDFQQLNQHSFFGSVMSSNEINWIHPQSNSGLWEQPQQSSPPQQPSNNNNVQNSSAANTPVTQVPLAVKNSHFINISSGGLTSDPWMTPSVSAPGSSLSASTALMGKKSPLPNLKPISKSEDIPPPSHNLTLQYNQQQLQLQQQQDQQQEELEDDVNGQSRYKTELCRSYQETGSCRYGFKCQFAHGGNELRHVSRHPKYKTETCKTFHTVGSCPYGSRCRFIHEKPDGSILQTSHIMSHAHGLPHPPVPMQQQIVSPSSSTSTSPSNSKPGSPTSSSVNQFVNFSAGSSGAGSPGSSVSKSPQLIKSQSEKNINWTSSWNSSDESSVITLGKLPSPPLKQKDMSPPSSSLQTTQQQQQQAQVDDSKRRLAIFRTICSNSWTD